MDLKSIPSYDDLPELGDTGERHAWDVFGPSDEIGTLNFISPSCVRSAAGLVVHGHVVNLDLPVGEPATPFWSGREPARRVETVARQWRDDRLDSFYLQAGSQWDGLRHFRFRQYGYYGGRLDRDLDSSSVLGIDRWAERGIVGRGVLLDVVEHYHRKGERLAPDTRLRITAETMSQVADEQGVSIEAGDILLIRTGWLSWYQSLTPRRREMMAAAYQRDPESFAYVGVDPRRQTVAWMWNRRIAAAATDTPGFEPAPYCRDDGWAHHRLLSLLGFAIGELWALDALAATCRELDTYAFMLVSSPLNVPAGVGSPPNAYAIF